MARRASEQVAELIRMEYVELPGLKLTFWQTQRLWNPPEDLCRQALTVLTQSRFLTHGGRRVRASPDAGVTPRPVAHTSSVKCAPHQAASSGRPV
jgi:hypothetical protein